MKRLQIGIALLGLCGLSATATAWWDTGHMVIAAIAETRLTPTAKQEADRLLKVEATKLAYSFITAGPWADDVRGLRPESSPFHYHDLFFHSEGKEVQLKQDERSALWAIDHFSKTLADRTKPDLERADALRFLIHIVGDVHQPMHGVARVTPALPQGDRGGNDFRLAPAAEFANMPRPPRNLHALWDFGGGIFVSEPRPLGPEASRKIEGMAAVLTAALPSESYAELKEMRPAAWIKESFDLACKYAYALPENSAPSSAYLAKVREVSARRATLAGYRLAMLVNRLLDPAP